MNKWIGSGKLKGKKNEDSGSNRSLRDYDFIRFRMWRNHSTTDRRRKNPQRSRTRRMVVEAEKQKGKEK